MRTASKAGFTLIEALITVIIIAILASMALPRYARTIEQQRCREAQDALLTIYAGERVYASVNQDQYYLPGVWKTIYMDDPTPPDGAINYGIVLGAGNTIFTATAKRIGGPKNNSWFQIDENRNISTSGDACPFDG